MTRLSLLATIFACLLAATSQAVENTLPGLTATYTQNGYRIVTLVPTPNFALKDNESIHPQLSPDFAAQWTGILKIDKRAKYTLTTDGSPGAEVRIDGNPAAGKSVDPDIGDHPIELSFTRKPGSARLQLI